MVREMYNRLDINKDTIKDGILKIADGNPGAMSVLLQLTKLRDGWMAVQEFDRLRLYGPMVWLCYKDLLGNDINRLLELILNGKLSEEITSRRLEDERFCKTWDYHLEVINRG